ncbi:hypothetical protein E3N88_39112 [Mikania micrantha]|uniref:Uncharacterized protein n=1 Tax=Mikania micrantha TaxID=192012 RepID=A0A5N6LWP4_9ASTR|nr:hypothetical protein E3N88_39112 [Mikania micrantha]
MASKGSYLDGLGCNGGPVFGTTIQRNIPACMAAWVGGWVAVLIGRYKTLAANGVVFGVQGAALLTVGCVKQWDVFGLSGPAMLTYAGVKDGMLGVENLLAKCPLISYGDGKVKGITIDRDDLRVEVMMTTFMVVIDNRTRMEVCIELQMHQHVK